MGWFRGDESADNQRAYGGKVPPTPLTAAQQRAVAAQQQAQDAVDNAERSGGNGITSGF